ncbi:MAG: GGDEF domain-containing protein [Eubacteriales bacterium]|nr:GGDEF domain-containing protein [Eubacteriales bacterium]
MKEKDKYLINRFTCRFKDNLLEQEYFDRTMDADKKYTQPLIILISVVFLLFIIPEMLLLSYNTSLREIFLIRFLTFVILIGLYIIIRQGSDNRKIAYLISIVELVLMFIYFNVMHTFASMEFLISVLNLVVLISVIFIIPNMFINKIAVAGIVFVGFFVFPNQTLSTMDIGLYAIAMTNAFLIVLMIGIVHYRVNYFDRVKFVNEKELIILSETDSLTKIYNRAKFDSELIKWIKIKDRYQNPLAVILMDFDHFKEVNDQHGHLKGDKVLVETARLMEKLIRETDIFARWGGEEFILLLPETDRTNAIKLAERIRETISTFDYELETPITCSFGVTEVFDNDNIYSVFDRVDELLYKAKDKGRNMVISEESA